MEHTLTRAKTSALSGLDPSDSKQRGAQRRTCGRAAGIALTFVSGYVNAITLGRYGTVGGPMTGNTIRLGVYLSSSYWEAALPVGLMLLAFYIGGVFMLAFLDCSSHG